MSVSHKNTSIEKTELELGFPNIQIPLGMALDNVIHKHVLILIIGGLAPEKILLARKLSYL